MSRLVITSRLGRLMGRMPHKIYLNGTFVGVMAIPSVRVELPEGQYNLTIQHAIPFLSVSCTVEISPDADTHVDFYSRERWWDILFSIDLLLCVLKLFLTFPSPWNLIYEVLTNGFFIVWLIYEWSIRKNYYKLDCYTTVLSDVK